MLLAPRHGEQFSRDRHRRLAEGHLGPGPGAARRGSRGARREGARRGRPRPRRARENRRGARLHRLRPGLGRRERPGRDPVSFTAPDPVPKGISPGKAPRMDQAALFSQHVSRLQAETEKALAESGAGLARRLERRSLHLLRRRPGRAVRAGAALRALVPARRAAPPPARRSRPEAPPRAPRAGGLLVRAGRGHRPVLARAPSSSRKRARSRRPGRRWAARRTPPTSGTRPTARPRPGSR